MTIAELLKDSGWYEAFGYCGELNACNYQLPEPIITYLGKCYPISREMVEEIIWAVDGENEGNPWQGIFKLKTGDYLFLEAGCDYTGWDCQSSGSSWLANSLGDLFQYGLTQSAKDLLLNSDFQIHLNQKMIKEIL